MAELNDIPGKPQSSEFFHHLSPEALRQFAMLEQNSIYPANTALFLEKDVPRGVFIVREGQVKLSIGSSDGKKLILRIAAPGELLDMTAAISGAPYDLTAETVHNCKVGFICREEFLRFLVRHPDAYQNLARELSVSYQRACDKLRAVVLSSSASERLAKLLLEWSKAGQETERGTRVKISMTHEEIGEFIGVSRETVTRTLNEFKHRKLVMLRGSTLMISNRVALENFAGA